MHIERPHAGLRVCATGLDINSIKVVRGTAPTGFRAAVLAQNVLDDLTKGRP